MDKIELAKPKAIASVCCSYFFTHRLRQQSLKAAMFTIPVVNRHAPPTHRSFGFAFFGKGQGFAHLGGTHESGRASAPLDSRGVRDIAAQSDQRLLNPLFMAMDIAAFHFFEAIATVMFDDLHMSRCPGNAEMGFRLWPTHALPGRVESSAEFSGNKVR